MKEICRSIPKGKSVVGAFHDRTANQDAFHVETRLVNTAEATLKLSLAIVCDGHGIYGDKVAMEVVKETKKSFDRFIDENAANEDALRNILKEKKAVARELAVRLKNCLSTTLEEVEGNLLKKGQGEQCWQESGTTATMVAIVQAVPFFDAEARDKIAECANTTNVYGPGVVICLNVGDSEAIIGRYADKRNSNDEEKYVLTRLSCKHRLDNQTERKRIFSSPTLVQIGNRMFMSGSEVFLKQDISFTRNNLLAAEDSNDAIAKLSSSFCTSTIYNNNINNSNEDEDECIITTKANTFTLVATNSSSSNSSIDIYCDEIWDSGFICHPTNPTKSLQLTRSIGDADMKSPLYSCSGVNAKCTAIVHCLDPSDQCIIVASDGLWDVISHEQAMKVALGTMPQKREAPVNLASASAPISSANGSEACVNKCEGSPYRVTKWVSNTALSRSFQPDYEWPSQAVEALLDEVEVEGRAAHSDDTTIIVIPLSDFRICK